MIIPGRAIASLIVLVSTRLVCAQAIDTVLLTEVGRYQHPYLLGTYSSSTFSCRIDRLDRPYIHMACWNLGLVELDISDPSQPIPVDTLTLGELDGLNAMNVEQVGPLLYVALGGFDDSTQTTGLAIVDVNDPTSDVSGLTVGENILTWTVDNGICGISSDNVSIFIFDENNAPANAGPDVEICTPQDSIFLAGNTPTFPATGTWSLVAGAGLFEDVSYPTSKVVGLSIGSNTFVWTVDNGPCNNPMHYFLYLFIPS